LSIGSLIIQWSYYLGDALVIRGPKVVIIGNWFY